MDEKSENSNGYKLGRHWQTIQRSLFPKWRESEEKTVEEEKSRRAKDDDAGRVSR